MRAEAPAKRPRIPDLSEDERKKAPVSLDPTANSLYTEAFVSNESALLLFDARGKVLDVNLKLEEISGYGRKELVGRSGLSLARLLTRKGPLTWLGNPLRRADRGVESSHTVDAHTKTGRPITLTLRSRVLIRNGAITGRLVTVVGEGKRQHDDTASDNFQEALRSLINNIEVGIFQTTPGVTGRFLEVNPAMEKITGYSREELLQMKVADLYLHPEERVENVRQVLSGAQTEPKEVQFKKKDGSVIVVRDKKVAVTSDDGQAVYLEGFLEDITDRKKAEEALRLEKEDFRNSTEMSPLGIQIITFEGKLVYVNRTMLEMWGYSSFEELKKTPIEQRFTPESIVLIGEINEQRRQGKIPPQHDVTMVCKDGRLRALTAYNKEIFWNGERCAEILYEDITERKRAEARLLELSAHQETILAAVPDIIMQVDNNKVYTWANAAGVDFFGDDVIGKEAAHYFAGEQDTYEAVQPVFEGTDATKYVESWQRRKDGVRRLLAWWCRSLKDEQGNVVGALSAAQDITERREAEEALRFSDAALRSIHEAVFSMDKNFIVTRWNDMCEKMFGINACDAIGEYIGTLISMAEGYPGQNKKRIELLTTRGYNREEQLYHTPRGDIWVDVQAQAIESDGKRVGWVTLAADISERRRAEEALRDSEKRYRDLVDNAPVGIVVTSLDGHILEVNRKLPQMHGYASREEFIRSPVSDRFHDLKDRERWIELTQKTGKVEGYEIRTKRKDGSLFWTSITSIPRTSETGEQQLITISQDITERKQAEDLLRQSEKKYSTLVEQGIDLIVIIQDGRLKFVNSKVAEMTGYTPDEALGRSFIDFISPPYRTLAADVYKKRISGEPAPKRYEIELLAKDGRKVPVETSGGTIEYEGRPADMVAIRDITERKIAEDTLKQSEEKLRLMFQSVAEGIVLVDLNGMIIDVNQRMLDMHGLRSKDEMIGKHTLEFVAPGDREKVRQSLRMTNERGFVDKLEVNALRADGQTFLVEVSAGAIRDKAGNPIGSVAALRDITETKRMQQQLLAQDRLASIGELVSGVAHEINNPLTGVIGFSQLLMERDLAADVKEELGIVMSEAQRAARIVKNLLTFARKHAPVKQSSQVNAIVEDVLKLRAYEQQVSNIQVVRHLAPDLPEIMADYFQLQQVFLNIIINAEFFMVEAHHRGTLTVTTERADGNVRILIADDGPGMPPGNLTKIFDPFFTTKEVGKGTGLGLSICHGIVTEHGGTIQARSEAGKGATFIVELPIDSPVVK